MDSLYLVMPAYNEEENIEEAVRAWYPVLDGKDAASRMVIADSGSTDGTHRILEGLQAEFPQLEILSDTGKQHGPKVIALYDYAIKSGADYIFQTDSDGQTNPAEFGRFWNLRGRYAGIFGFRKERGDGKVRAFVEKVVCLLLNLYFHVTVPDANAPFRLMRADVVEKYLYRMEPDYNLPNIMLTTFFAYYNEKIRFRKITFRPRQAGANSVNIRKIVQIGWKALGDFRAFKKDMSRDAQTAPLDAPEAYPELLETPSGAADKPDAETVAAQNEMSAPDMPESEPPVTDADAETPEALEGEPTPDAETVTPDASAESVTAETSESEPSAPDAETVAAPNEPDAPETEESASGATDTPDAETKTTDMPGIEPDAESAEGKES